MTDTTTRILKDGDHVTYLGHLAAVVHGNEPDEWRDTPSQVVNVRFTSEVPGHSRQFDMYVSALLPA